MSHEDANGYNCLDVCILNINYQTALFLFQTFDIKPKVAEFYKTRAVSKDCDFELFIRCLQSGRETVDKHELFERAGREREEFLNKDLVVDVRETWTEVLKRIRDFKEQKLIPREELPPEYHPHRSFYAKLANWSAGIDYHKPKPKSTDVELNQTPNSFDNHRPGIS